MRPAGQQRLSLIPSPDASSLRNFDFQERFSSDHSLSHRFSPLLRSRHGAPGEDTSVPADIPAWRCGTQTELRSALQEKQKQLFPTFNAETEDSWLGNGRRSQLDLMNLNLTGGPEGQEQQLTEQMRSCQGGLIPAVGGANGADLAWDRGAASTSRSCENSSEVCSSVLTSGVQAGHPPPPPPPPPPQTEQRSRGSLAFRAH